MSFLLQAATYKIDYKTNLSYHVTAYVRKCY